MASLLKEIHVCWRKAKQWLIILDFTLRPDYMSKIFLSSRFDRYWFPSHFFPTKIFKTEVWDDFSNNNRRSVTTESSECRNLQNFMGKNKLDHHGPLPILFFLIMVFAYLKNCAAHIKPIVHQLPIAAVDLGFDGTMPTNPKDYKCFSAGFRHWRTKNLRLLMSMAALFCRRWNLFLESKTLKRIGYTSGLFK